MNHIKKLQAHVRGLKAERETLHNGLTDLMVYLNSSKFYCGDTLDGYVNIQDVLNRLAEAKKNAWTVNDEYQEIYGKI